MIIHLERLSDGKRILSSLSEIISSSKTINDSNTLEVKEIFKLQEQDKKTPDNLIYTGMMPGFINKIKKKDLYNDFENALLG